MTGAPEKQINAVFAYITAPDRDEAMKIARALVHDKLAACSNVFDNMTSVYHWQGDICEDGECVIIAKTTDEKFDDVCAKVSQIHSYETPCVIALPVSGGFPPFLQWLGEQVTMPA